MAKISLKIVFKLKWFSHKIPGRGTVCEGGGYVWVGGVLFTVWVGGLAILYEGRIKLKQIW